MKSSAETVTTAGNVRAERTPATPVLSSVVAIGSSANGYRSLGTILESLPADFPGAVVIVQHLAPSAKSALVKLLARRTRLVVREGVDGEPLQGSTVYVAPPGRHLSVRAGRLAVTDTQRVSFSRPSVDVLFHSVATAYGPRAIGVVLSGGGSDGARGLQSIRRAGGRTIVQHPSDAAVPGMPRAAIGRDGIDFVVGLHEVGPLLAKLVATPGPSG